MVFATFGQEVDVDFSAVDPHAAGMRARRNPWATAVCIAAATLSACAAPPRVEMRPAAIERFIPAGVAERSAWTDALMSAFAALAIEPTPRNVCATVAVIEQESGFQVDPVVPGLPAIAWREIDARAARVGLPAILVHGALAIASVNGRSYAARIDHARTEKDLSDVYEDFIAAVPLGRTLLADGNPIRTRGPMQVEVKFAAAFAAKQPYPYPVKTSIAEELFTRRGGVYFGVAHLLDYDAPYDRYLYRFADFNAGQYASRNAAFQRALAAASGIRLTADGALLAPGGDAGPGATERAARALARRLDLDDADIHHDLAQGKTAAFQTTHLYQAVFRLGDTAARRILPRAAVPDIELHGPKLTRRLTTAWYADRVNTRFERCLGSS